MGHEIKFWDFPVTTNKKDIEEKINAYVAAEDWQEGASGLPAPIKWLDEVHGTRSEALKAIEQRCTHDYDEFAVQYYEKPADYKPTQAYTNLQERLSIAHKRHYDLSTNPHFSNIKAEFVGCPSCGSKIARKYLKGNFCPVCHTDMRPVSTMDCIKRAAEKVDQLEKQMVAAERKEAQRYKSKANLRWLVRFEYHT